MTSSAILIDGRVVMSEPLRARVVVAVGVGYAVPRVTYLIYSLTLCA